MATFPVRYRLPVSHSTEIGRIITRWAFLEWRLRETAYVLLDLGPKQGRIAVREPRATDYVTMIQDLCTVSKIKVSTDLKKLKKSLLEYGGHRDALAHGIWLKHPGSRHPTLQVVAGSYPPSPGEKAIKARIDPQSMSVDLPQLKLLSKAIEMSTAIIERLRSEIIDELAKRDKESLKRLSQD